MSETRAAALLELCAGVAPAVGPASKVDGCAMALFLFAQTVQRPGAAAHTHAAAIANREHWPEGGGAAQAPSGGGSPHSPRSPRRSAAAAARATAAAAEGELRAHAAEVRRQVAELLHLCMDAGGPGGSTGAVAADLPVRAEELDRLGMLLTPCASSRLALSRLAPFFAAAGPGDTTGVSVGEVALWLVERIVAPGELPGQGGAASGPTSSMQPDNTPDGASASGGAGGGGTAGAQGAAADGRGGGLGLSARCARVDGLQRGTAVRSEGDIAPPGDFGVAECVEGVVYALAPIRRAMVSNCRDSVVVLGAVGSLARLERCERTQLLVCCRRLVVSNCHDCTLYLATNTPPVFVGDNRNVVVAPFNTYYPSLRAHLEAVGVDPSVNRWDTVALLEEEGELVRAEVGHAGPGAAQAAVHAMPPNKFVPFIVPVVENGPGGAAANADASTQTHTNPFVLPPEYAAALEAKVRSVAQLRGAVKDAALSDTRRRELQGVIQAHFKDWLLHSGNMRQVFDLARQENGEGR